MGEGDKGWSPRFCPALDLVKLALFSESHLSSKLCWLPSLPGSPYLRSDISWGQGSEMVKTHGLDWSS